LQHIIVHHGNNYPKWEHIVLAGRATDAGVTICSIAVLTGGVGGCKDAQSHYQGQGQNIYLDQVLNAEKERRTLTASADMEPIMTYKVPKLMKYLLAIISRTPSLIKLCGNMDGFESGLSPAPSARWPSNNKRIIALGRNHDKIQYS